MGALFVCVNVCVNKLSSTVAEELLSNEVNKLIRIKFKCLNESNISTNGKVVTCSVQMTL